MCSVAPDIYNLVIWIIIRNISKLYMNVSLFKIVISVSGQFIAATSSPDLAASMVAAGTRTLGGLGGLLRPQ